MKKIPVITTVPSTIAAITQAAQNYTEQLQINTYSKVDEVCSFFKYEMPEIKIIDFGDTTIEAQKCLDEVREDPWLLFGGVIIIVNEAKDKHIFEEQKDPNILLIVTRTQFEKQADQIINMLIQNQHFLFNRGVSQISEGTESGNFVSNTDPFEVLFYSNLISNYLYTTDRVNATERDSFHNAMMELLLNAVEHGNCEISYDEKTDWLEHGKDPIELVEKKLQNPENSKKKIFIEYIIRKKTTTITIRDEGKGFDWRAQAKAKPELGLHGMGINLSRTLVKNLRYNDKGNQVSFDIINQKNVANFTPLILRDSEVLHFSHLEVAMKEGEEAKDLFFIASGRFAIYVSGKLLSVLSPADIFIGEMALLLNNRRSATVLAIGNNASLVKIKKSDFMSVTTRYPHYGIFLARLLASRLARQSKATVELKSTLKNIDAQNGNNIYLP